jgi:MFS family permease
MSVWGATAGVATLVGPLAGGLLVDRLGWQWIFFVNVPIGVIGLALAAWLVPVLPRQRHRFDVLGVLLSGLAMFLLVFGLQEGQSHNWAPWIWATIAGGVLMMVVFVYWQSINRHEPLIPLRLFNDRGFSVSNVGVAVIGFTVTGMVLPVMFYAQAVCGLSPTRAALLTAPMAVATGVLAPVVGRLVDRSHPGAVIGFGFAALAIALTWLSIEMTPATPIWRLVLPFIGMGVGMAFIWAPLAATATRNLPPQQAGAGSGVYNATRQVGSVLGSASMAAFMTARLSAEMPPDGPGGEGAVTRLPDFLHGPFSAAMSQSTLLPAFVSLFGVVAALFLVGFRQQPPSRRDGRFDDGAGVDESEPRTDVFPTLSDEDALAVDTYDGYFEDDDDYAEFVVSAPQPLPDDSDTEPLATRTDPTRGEPVELWPKPPVETLHRDRLDTWHRPSVEPIGFAHNGFHVDRENRFQEFRQHYESDSGGAHAAESRQGGAHHRRDSVSDRVDVDPDNYGRHAMPSRD